MTFNKTIQKPGLITFSLLITAILYRCAGYSTDALSSGEFLPDLSLKNVQVKSSTSVQLVYQYDMQAADVKNIDNYQIKDNTGRPLNVTAVEIVADTDNKSVILTTAPQTANAAYTLTVFNVNSQQGRPAPQSGLSIEFTGYINPGATYSISGNLSGLYGGDVVLTLNSSNDLTLSSDGSFTFGISLLSNSSYTVAVKTDPGDVDCTVSNGNGIINHADVTDVVVTCSDVVAPTAGSSGTLTVANLSTNSLDLSWSKSTDNMSSQASLQYRVYYSTNSAFDSVAEVKANGTEVTSGYTTDINSQSIASLLDDTTYYLNVLVRDEAGNEAAYAKKSVLTLTADPIYLFGGRSTTNGQMTNAFMTNHCSDTLTNYYTNGNGGWTDATICTGDNVKMILSDAPGYRFYGVPTNRPYKGPTGKTIATSYDDLMDGSIMISLRDADVFIQSSSDYGQFWSGYSGSFNTYYDCDGWTGTSGYGYVGRNAATENWLDNNDWDSCSSGQANVLCLCYD